MSATSPNRERSLAEASSTVARERGWAFSMLGDARAPRLWRDDGRVGSLSEEKHDVLDDSHG